MTYLALQFMRVMGMFEVKRAIISRPDHRLIALWDIIVRVWRHFGDANEM
jgi:hypothetical protein